MEHTCKSEGTQRHSPGGMAEQDPLGPRPAGASGELERRCLRTGPLEAGRRRNDPRHLTLPQEVWLITIPGRQ